MIKIGTNSTKTHPKFKRVFKSGHCAYGMHAEMNVVRFAQPGDDLLVMRFLADKTISCSRPCPACLKAIKAAGIKKVTYTNWDGDFVTARTSTMS